MQNKFRKKYITKITFHLKGCAKGDINLLLGITIPILVSFRLAILGFLVSFKY